VKKFLIVGCGGSGGATLRYLMDQLRADLRPYGVDELPAAWQFLHVDVNPEPEGTDGLGTIRDLGGRYLSVSSPGNSYMLVANNVEQSLMANSSLRGLMGWAPAPKEAASHVGVTKGAGQYRSVGRMLTLTDLNDIRAEMSRSWEQLQRPDAWGSLPTAGYPGSYDAASGVIPMVVGSMAGGSGASMFLDVCRLLGRLPGLNRADLGVFLFTADVFAALPAAERTGVDGNALGAIGEIIAAQTRASDAADTEIFSALGIAPEPVDEAAFARIFPIGASIGGDGAKFGDGTPEGVFRGLGRALAATMSSDEATNQYIKSKIENPSPPTMNREVLGWGTDSAVFPWGSFGYASLSLGRDRYAEYASQRVARNALDRLVVGHLNPQSQLPANEQLNSLVDAQFNTILERLGYPRMGSNIPEWFRTAALSENIRTAEAQNAVSEAVSALGATDASAAPAWVDAIRVRLPYYQVGAATKIRDASYLWANGWAQKLEAEVREEYLRAVTQLGVPYAVAVVRKLASHLNPVIDKLREAVPMREPLAIDPDVTTMALGMKKTVIGAGHAVAELITKGYVSNAKRAMELEAARLGGEVLASFAQDVLGALQRAGESALMDLTAARALTSGEAGLAQLATTVYNEWPQDSDQVPTRFDQADNEVLLTTSREFPAQFESDVIASVPAANSIYSTARDSIVSEVLIGRWQTTGGVRGDFPVLTARVAWRASALPKDPISETPTPRSVPVYDLAVRPREVLERAREHLRRPDQPFESFSSQTIEEYLYDVSQPESVRVQRAEELVGRFREAMALARPLVGVSPPMIQVMHPSHSLLYQYSFSAIPVAPSAPVAGRIRAMLQADSTLDSSTERRFSEALSDTAQANRIAIFGSYPKYSPLVFSSLLDQIEKRWTGAPEMALNDLWQWKRTRPLPASLAMGATEQRTMIEGWWIGRLLGALVVPASAQSTDPAQVWDFARQAWLAFPQRLLTPPSKFRGPDDWLPAVMESHSLALVRCNGDVNLGALQPYLALRRISDDSPEAPHGAYGLSTGVRHLSDWLGTGAWPSGQPSVVLDAASLTAPGVTPETRAEAAKKWLEQVANYVAEQYLTDGGGVGALAARKARVTNVAELARAPMFAEIAETVHQVLLGLVTQVDAALAEAGAGPMSGESNVHRPIL
jgi:hypothetical protein